MLVTLKQAKKCMDTLNIDLSVISVHDFKKAMKVEFEHNDIVKGNLLVFAKIVCAHLEEFPDYYVRLDKLEEKAKKFWKGKYKPSIYKN